ncbi:MAG: aldo/keto reductase [Chloroherpetonaceae bacterium]|nr:aldo/keto reductase [Chthonomonadaceae bacterium]MDW8208432.1 aldo/keto reductase [Chloroherpetonaceae bacterium]
MQYGSIPGVALPVARIILGSMVCTTDAMEATRALLDAYVQAGGNAIDTAHLYHGGKSERAIGQWMQERGNRDRIVLITKGAHPTDAGPRVTPGDITQDLTESLDRLQTDRIDIYLLHRDDENVPVEPIIECLNQHCAEGRIVIFGASNWSTARIDAANAYARQQGLRGFSVSSPHFSLALTNEPVWAGCVTLDDAGRQWHRQNQMPLLPWSAQARGFFTGRFTPDDTSSEHMVRVYYNDTNWERYRRAQELALQKGCDARHIALAYVLAEPYPVFALIGPATIAELQDSLRALDVALSPRERAYLELRADLPA